ncbi:MAG TPA: ferritin-like domain-containing protein [Actinomycetota bacterium]|nr:ferritin-like domain-containing protein [Actinomycetota bacterium]
MDVRAFELDRYLRASKKLDLDGIDFDRVPDHPLSHAEIRCLTYMMDIERHTVIYLRDLLATNASRDPEITAFLSMWVYEEFWHGEAIGRFLRAAGIDHPSNRTAQIRAYADAGRAIANTAKAIAGKVIPDFVAVHMTWGAMNEISTLYGYQQMIARTRNPVLVQLLGRIIKDERRHFAFYFNQARARLDGNRRAQRLVHWALGSFWTPVGTGVRPQQETDFVVCRLFGDDEGLESIREMEREMSKLPGLAGMRLMRRARDRALERSGTAARRKELPIAAFSA